MPEVVVIHGGRRQGRTLGSEAAFRAAVSEGKKVYTWLNGVWFRVEVGLLDDVQYLPCPSKPDDLPEDHAPAMNRPFQRAG